MNQCNIILKMGEGAVTTAPNILSSTGIGSCVVITMYDFRRKRGGMAHIMLPGTDDQNRQDTPYQYADTAVVTLLRIMLSTGTSQQDFVAKIVGGAQMFLCSDASGPGIGNQNVNSIKRILSREGIRLGGEEVGGNCGRNVDFYLDSGKVIVKTAGKKEDVKL
jgi:chemotaxis protein CheD